MLIILDNDKLQTLLEFKMDETELIGNPKLINLYNSLDQYNYELEEDNKRLRAENARLRALIR